MKPYVCVVGAVNLDICGRPEKKLIFRDSNPGAVTLTPGGVGRNIAHDLRLLGVEVKFLTAFGGDSHAQLLRNDCVELGMDLSCALDVPGGRTSTYLYITDERGEMQLGLCDTDISAAITPAYLQRHLDVLNSAAAVVLDGNLTAETITWLGTHCSAPLFADPVSVTKAERMRAALGALHTFKPNLTEGQNLTGESTPEGIVAALLAQGIPEADRVAQALDLYVSGSLNVFNHRTNIDIQNRIVAFDIKELGKQLKKIGMLIVQDQIWGRVTQNRSKGKATWYFCDEFHLLLREEQTAAFSCEIWKRFRKWGGIPTGATQNVKDLLSSPEIENILENSDFICLLNQASGDRKILAERLNISPQQLRYVDNSEPGEGLLIYENVILPFKNPIPKNTQLYQIMTTRLGEGATV